MLPASLRTGDGGTSPYELSPLLPEISESETKADEEYASIVPKNENLGKKEIRFAGEDRNPQKTE